jgi:hypothetical protein
MFLGTKESGGECSTSIYEILSLGAELDREDVPKTPRRRGSGGICARWIEWGVL